MNPSPLPPSPFPLPSGPLPFKRQDTLPSLSLSSSLVSKREGQLEEVRGAAADTWTASLVEVEVRLEVEVEGGGERVLEGEVGGWVMTHG